MKHHLVTAAVAASVALAAAGAVITVAPPRQVHVTEQVTRTIAVSKHAWPDLSDAEKAALAGVLKTVPKATKFEIICDDAGCADLAADIDDAMEQAGLSSVLDHAIGPLGYGIALRVNAFDRAAAEAASAALKRATAGRLDLPVTEAAPNTNPAGYVTILIGKYKPNG